MTYDSLQKTMSKSKETSDQSFFVKKCLTNTELELSTNELESEIVRCEQCNFPLRSRITAEDGSKENHEEISDLSKFVRFAGEKESSIMF